MINLRPYYYFEPKEIEHENGSDHLVVGRVINKNRGHFSILHDQGISDATLSGKFIHEALYHVDYPSVGDWVLMVEKSQQEADYIIKNNSTIESIKKQVKKLHQIFLKKSLNTNQKS